MLPPLSYSGASPVVGRHTSPICLNDLVLVLTFIMTTYRVLNLFSKWMNNGPVSRSSVAHSRWLHQYSLAILLSL